MAAPRPANRRHVLERRIHLIALRALDLTAADRRGVVEAMFNRRRRDAVSYWLQLLLSMAIATVGLVLGSTAVVIGAMLIAPLMGPIVELGMGLVVGSAVLTLRSFARMVGSVLAVMGGAALLTVLLPFQEVTGEIASRTSPTALDLLLAVFVAVAAAFTTARPGSDSTSAAAGTAIGIALVPPICVAGFGLGVRDAEIAGGATLLFITNLTAILLVSVVFFWTLGFERVDQRGWEEAALAESRPDGFVRRSVEVLHRLFGSRYGRVLRVGLPLLLVVAVFVPLRRALEQVAWEVRARSAVSRILDEALESRSAVQSQMSVSPGAVSAHLYLVGSADEAAALEDEMAARIAARTGVVPSVRVVAVPDVGALRQASAESAPPPQVGLDVGDLRQRVGAAVRSAWPEGRMGPLLGWTLEVPDSAAPRVRIEYLGEPGGPAADALLGRALSERIGTGVDVGTRAYPRRPATAPGDGGEEWLPALLGAMDAARGTGRLYVCVGVPGRPALARDTAQAKVAERARAEALSVPDGRVAVDSAGAVWSVRYSAAPCVHPDSAAAPSAVSAPVPAQAGTGPGKR